MVHGTDLILCWIVVYLLLIGKSLAADGDSALPGFHPLTLSQAGDLLILELRCAACHKGIERRGLSEKLAPDLAQAGARISPEYLKPFIIAPSSVHLGTTMPDVLASKPADERQRIAEALTHFLVAQSIQEFHAETSFEENIQQGKILYHSVGCVACHGPREAIGETPLVKRSVTEVDDEDEKSDERKAIKPIAVSLGHVATKYSLKSLSEFLFQPLRVRPSGRMPDMKLTPSESLAVASYLIGDQRKHVRQLVPYAVIFPYIRMGRSITAFTVNKTQGKFGPFENQMFLGDYTLSILMRATTEQVNGVWQGACYPFREGLSTGILNVEFTPEGKLLCGGTNCGWPVRGIKPFALERVDWSGKMPFEINRITIEPDGFKLTFTKPVDRATGKSSESYALSAFTHPYHGGYGGPEVDRFKTVVKKVSLAEDGLSANIVLDKFKEGFVYEFDLGSLRSRDGEEPLHRNAFYTVNEIPSR